MNRLLDHLRAQLARRTPATLGMDQVEAALRRERIAVTRSVLERTVREDSTLLLLRPWRGANRGLGWRRHDERISLAPRRPSISSPWTARRAAGDAQLRFGATRVTGVALDRAVRTLGCRGDTASITAMARWVRLSDEATRAHVRARPRPLSAAA